MLFRSKIFTGLSVKNQKKRLNLSLAIFVLLLSIPLSFLVKIGFDQFQKDVFLYHLWNSKHVMQNAASDIHMHIKVENNRSIDDYQFFKARNNAGNYDSNATLSPLASIPDKPSIPGLLSYFQIDESGAFSCPLLPFTSKSSESAESVNHILTPEEVEQRLLLREEIKPILAEKGFIKTKKPKAPPAPGPGSNIPDDFSTPAPGESSGYPSDIKKISLLKLKRSKTEHLIFYRKIWNGENKLIQGFVADEQALILDTLRDHLEIAEFGTDVLMQVYYKGKHISSILHTLGKDNAHDASFVALTTKEKKLGLKKMNFPAPLEHYSLSFSVDRLPIGDGTKTGGIFLAIVVLIIIGGLVVFYRLGVQQINLNAERLNFVSSVSHELKTPLTSIIMYADMLRSGMFTEQSKRTEYYNYIFFEGERLGRLIGNVLRLSKLGQDSADISLEFTPLSAAVDILRSKTSTVIENNNFKLNVNSGDDVSDADAILIDRDAFTQIAINLVDNAVKFTTEYLSRPDTQANKNSRQIDINISKDKNQSGVLKLGVRDYGPGISKDDEKHIFKSFYRAGNELTRKTTGTGMGLALVCELAQAMDGHVEFFNREQGTEFIVNFQLRKSGK